MMRMPLPISVRGKVIVDGPLVVPSFSSKALPRTSVDTTLRRTANFIVSPVLISAYDIVHHDVDLDLLDVPLIIVDSGGYETLVDEESRRKGGLMEHAALPWSAEMYAETLTGLRSKASVIAVSYDRTWLSVGEQINAALEARDGRAGNAFLLKPRAEEILTIESLRDHIGELDGFDLVGVTEKEAGSSFMERLVFIGRLRALMDERGVTKPIHVFGGLDPLMTPLYFLAGADVVDGLSWLRFAFGRHGAQYLPAYAALTDAAASLQDFEWKIRRANYGVAVGIQNAFRRFRTDGRYEAFSADGEATKVLAGIHATLLEALDASGSSSAFQPETD